MDEKYVLLNMTWWESVKNYYITIGEKYEVDPLLFVGIHVVATPLFAAAVAWIIYNKKKKQSLVLPSVVGIFIFNAANIYLIIFGKKIPFYIFAFVGTTAVISGYFTWKKIKKKIAAIK